MDPQFDPRSQASPPDSREAQLWVSIIAALMPLLAVLLKPDFPLGNLIALIAGIDAPLIAWLILSYGRKREVARGAVEAQFAPSAPPKGGEG